MGSLPAYFTRCHHFATYVNLNLHVTSCISEVLPHACVNFSFASYKVNRGFDPLLFPSVDLVLV
jgi:hypothetical protein